jgi:hypothetical protein
MWDIGGSNGGVLDHLIDAPDLLLQATAIFLLFRPASRRWF